jgi:glycine/D-amino acid oxidase-like deaminating enzyme
MMRVLERGAEMTEMRADVVVVGGGIVGCATAYYLSKRGVDVVLVEKGEIADEQSSRAWGFVRQQGRDPAEMPLMIECNRMWQGLEDELDADIEWVQGGNLALADSEERMGLFRDWLKVAADFGLETRVLSRSELQSTVPGMTGPRVSSLIGGMWTPSDGHAEPRPATVAFADAARRRGARILTFHAAEDIETTAGQVSAVVTDRGVIRTPVVVNAAGARAMKIARMAGLSLPQLVVRATVAETTPVERVTDAGVWAPGVSFRQKRDGSFYIAGGAQSDYDITLDSFRYMRQFMPNYLKNRRLFRLRVGPDLFSDVAALIPGTEAREHPFANTVGIEPRPNLGTARKSLKGLQSYLPAAREARIRRTWAGLIDTTPDAIPVLGDAGSPGGFVFATGFSGHGFALGPIAGRLMAELIVDGQPSIPITGMEYSRFREGRVGKPRSVV